MTTFMSLTFLLVLAMMIEFFKSPDPRQEEGTVNKVRETRTKIKSNELNKMRDLFRSNLPTPKEEVKDDEGAVTVVREEIKEEKKPKRVAVDVGKFKNLFEEKDETEKMIINTHTIYLIRNMSVQEIARLYQVT